MAGFKDVFQRIEVKYLLDDKQYTELMKRLENMAAIDSYGQTSILNIYFDIKPAHGTILMIISLCYNRFK